MEEYEFIRMFCYKFLTCLKLGNPLPNEGEVRKVADFILNEFKRGNADVSIFAITRNDGTVTIEEGSTNNYIRYTNMKESVVLCRIADLDDNGVPMLEIIPICGPHVFVNGDSLN